MLLWVYLTSVGPGQQCVDVYLTSVEPRHQFVDVSLMRIQGSSRTERLHTSLDNSIVHASFGDSGP